MDKNNIARITVFAFFSVFLLSSCNKKQMASLQATHDEVQLQLSKYEMDLKDCRGQNNVMSGDLAASQKELAIKTEQFDDMKQQLDFMKKTNTNLLDRLEDLSVINKSGAESIRKSLESINNQNDYIKNLNESAQKKDSLNLALVMNLKRSLDNINDEDVNVEVRGGVVYVSISDKLLFNSGSSVLSQRAKEVLGKVAKVVKDHKDINVMVEGHTDNVPISTDCVMDNWDLSTRRSANIVRVLQKDYAVDPTRLTVAGRSEYAPKADNSTPEGRKTNRRTEIIITPRMDQFFNLMTVPEEVKE